MVRAVPLFLPAFTHKCEGRRYKAYLDSKHVWTCGDGHTGPDVGPDTTCNDGTADRWLYEDLSTAAARVARYVPASRIDALSENRWGAICDFAFNLGFNPTWQIVADLRTGNLGDVPFQIGRFNKYQDPQTGKYLVSEGLNHRRAAEVAMWNTPDPMDARKLSNPPPIATAIMANAAGVAVPSSALLRNVSTPPAAAPGPGFLARIFGGHA